MEVVIIMMLVLIAIELALILTRITEGKEEKINPRREIEGKFKDPLGDMYRKNTKGLYRPVRPSRGDDEDEDL